MAHTLLSHSCALCTVVNWFDHGIFSLQHTKTRCSYTKGNKHRFYNSKDKKHFFLNFFQVFNYFAWTLSFVSMATIALVNYPLAQLDPDDTPLKYGLYYGLSRVIWSIALCYIIFACAHNYGGPINWFLAHRFWQPISRMSFTIYLLQIFVISKIFMTKTPVYFNKFLAVSITFLDFNHILNKNIFLQILDCSLAILLEILHWFCCWRPWYRFLSSHPW